MWVHHAREVAHRVLPGCLAAHSRRRQVLITDDKPEVVHARLLDGDGLLKGVGNGLIVLKVDVQELWPAIFLLLQTSSMWAGIAWLEHAHEADLTPWWGEMGGGAALLNHAAWLPASLGMNCMRNEAHLPKLPLALRLCTSMIRLMGF